MDGLNTSQEQVLFTIMHVFMPPKLPQHEDPDRTRKEVDLLDWVANAATKFKERVDAMYPGDTARTRAWLHTQKMLKLAASLHRHGSITAKDLSRALSAMQEGDVLPVLVQAQNAGIIFRKRDADKISFESFEVQIPAEKVTGTVGKLVVQYPANSREVFPANHDHIIPISNLVEYLAAVEQDDALPHTRKGGTSHQETRDVASPRYITEALAGILRAANTANAVPSPTVFIHKRINDHVLWKSAKLPWRRSPMWLLIRVALQTTLEEFKVPTELGYKALMISFMASVIERAAFTLSDALPSHLLHFMNSKVSRRLYKMGDIVEEKNVITLQEPLETVKQISARLEARWMEIQEEHAATTQWSGFDLKLLEGSDKLTFDHGNNYLRQVLSRKSALQAQSSYFDSSHITRELLKKCRVRNSVDPNQLPNSLAGLEPDVALYDFETWIERYLPAWKTSSLRSIRDCLPISRTIETYRDMAVSAYDSKPELLSVMYLCILELWIALDMIVTRWCPLLLEYSPELPRDLMDPLLLPYREQLVRLSEVQAYLNTRHDNASQRGSPSVFDDVNRASSFANRFFNLPLGQSLRDLKARILQSWEIKKSDKIIELDRFNEEYRALMRRSDALLCTQVEVTNRWGDSYWQHRDYQCTKCQLAKSARNLKVIPLEETLPRNIHQAQAAVFELQCPEPFSVWRDATRSLLLSVSEPQTQRSNTDIRPLASYSTLAEFFKKAYPGQQVGLASSAKSVSQSHYGSARSLPATRDQIIVGHAGRWASFDIGKNSWLDEDGHSVLRKRLVFMMEGPYASLQKYVVDTSHSPNSIIAALDSCPKGLSPSEYLAFSQLRAGNAIQWLNIARALSAQTLSFSEYSVFGLILQAIWQVGPEARADSSHTLNREAHQDLADEAFGRELVRELSTGLESMHGNWKQAYYLGTVVALALKLHSLALSTEVKELASGVLRQARDLAAVWIKELTEFQGDEGQSDVPRQDTRNYHLAMICAVLRWTFDMELDGRTPFQTEKDATRYVNAIVVASSIFARPSLPRGLSALLYRDRRLALKLDHHLQSACSSHKAILDDCVEQFWPSYIPGSLWTRLSNHGSRWWSTRTAQHNDRNALHLHLNLLDGTLLINGKSSNVLPADVVHHVVYRELFKDHDVGTIRSSSMTGMDYEIGYLRHQIHIRLLGSDLIVRRAVNSGVEEFIPAAKLHGDLPTHFMAGHHFWYLEDESKIEIRPVSRTWETGHVRHWKMKTEFDRSTITARAYKLTGNGQKRLINPTSTIYRSLSKTLRPLEKDPLGVVVTMNDVEEESTLHAHLPHHDISFSLTENGQLECQSAPGFVVQADRRGLGCLIGLESLLCLHQPALAGYGQKVIIPKGKPVVQSYKYGHTKVSIDLSARGGCFIYDVDRIVGRLVGSRTVESDLFLILLHAYTSSTLHDPLTEHTGTEEALRRLRNGSIFSAQMINKTLRVHLDQLANLTPQRSFYPQYLRVMETVEWDPAMPPQSQSSDFRECVEMILAHWKQGLAFHQEEEAVSALPEVRGMDHLTARVQCRDWTRTLHDQAVRAADVHHDSTDSLRSKTSRERELRAFHAMKLARDVTNRPNLAVSRKLINKVQKWETVTGDQKWSWGRVRGWIKVPSASPATIWCSLYELCRKTQSPVPFEAQSALGIMAYMDADHDLIANSIAVMRLANRMPPVPKFTSLPLSMGSDWNAEVIRRIVKSAEKGFTQSDEYRVPKREAETHQSHHERRQSAYDRALLDAVAGAVQETRRMWPEIPNVVSFRPNRLLSTSSLANPVHQKLKQWEDNKSFLQFIGRVEGSILLQSGPEAKQSEYRPISLFTLPQKVFLQRQPLSSILTTRSTPSISVQDDGKLDSGKTASTTPLAPQTLSVLLTRLSPVPLRQDSLPHRYVQNLAQSIEYLEKSTRAESRRCPSKGELEAIFAGAAKRYSLGRDAILDEFTPFTNRDMLLQLSGMLPPISTHILLRQISQNYRRKIPAKWISTLADYAVVVQSVQRAIRMLQHLVYDRRAHLIADFHHQRHWNVEEHLDWLLVEIDGNFSIRENQAEIASCMMHPDEHRVKNAVMQLNMGEGKSSVIIPAISASLANGQVLCRVIVPRAQTKQQHQLLRRTLTDLSGRIIFSLPFNRNVPLDATSATSLMQHLSKMAEIGAIWLCEPEQLLSLKLLGLDKTMRTTTDSACGKSLIRLQLWLDDNTRDILDESDDILNTKQQVIYTVGTQRNFDAAPLRWEVVQKLLGLLAKHLTTNPSHEDDQIYVKPSTHPAGFPLIRIRSEHGRERLLSFIEMSFQRNEWSLPQSLLGHALQYVSCRDPTSSVEGLIRSYCSGDDEYVMQTLLILRGMFSSDILLHALKDKRFRVHYGLDLKRTPVAIPFRAKDFPSLRSEFGHPDVTIVLTCLSYYYRGLDDSMIHRSIVQLLASNTPDLTYNEWLTDCWDRVRLDLRSIRGINMDDQQGLHRHLYPLLKFNKTVIDFYLKEFVFPRYAKEFPEKLCSSGWDLAAKKSHSTTGFSGTNDGRFLLPTTISQLDRLAQMHTNAKVLDYLLLEENNRVVSYDSESSSEAFLNRVMKLGSRPTVILDVGAQILDQSNKAFAQSWLSRHNEHGIIKAALYFDDQDSLAVITSDGISQPFLDSPYVDRLDQCLVYLDDAHTRGTDLRLPDTQAVVTLGPRLNKDKLVQGCMRMRRLGHGHTLIFMAPQDVSEHISRCSEHFSGDLTSMEVVIWTIQETWRQLQADAPAWMMQGESYVRRLESWEQLKAVGSIPSGKDLAARFCEPEARSLEDLYGVRIGGRQRSEYATKTSNGLHIMQRIRKHCQGFEAFSLQDAGVHEEMEIELVHEKEVEREVQRLASAEPAKHVLHPDVLGFVTSGVLPANTSRAFCQADAALAATTLRIPRGFMQVFSKLLMTKDFYRTIEIPAFRTSGAMDQFIRPVEWIVTFRGSDNGATSLVFISPYEANALLHLFRQSKRIALHIFSARSSLSLQSMEDLQRFAVPGVQQPIPRNLAISLNFFSGALYIRDKKTYEDICGLLRLKLEDLPAHLATPLVINSTGFVKMAAARRELGMPDVGFEDTALPFFRKFITMRRYGKEFGPSHMGKLLYGKKLENSDFV